MTTVHEQYVTGFYSSNNQWIVYSFDIDDIENTLVQLELNEDLIYCWTYIVVEE